MKIINLIDKKVLNKELSKEEIDFIINGYTKKIIPDYQMSAFLMAIVFNGMNNDEITYLTKAMIESGEIIDLSSISGIKTDKHSTGGVGDKVTIALAPIVAACGAKMAKMSGRGLGFTGGTIDKLESIPGFQVEQSIESFNNLVNENGLAIIAQTGDIVPADKYIYALRDVTGTVASIPLIAASIMSKKIATGSDTILLDVKVGNAAFMKTLEDAKELGKIMINIGKKLGKDVRVEITSMNKPLGRTIGNRNEIIEAMETLKGNGPKDFMEIILSSGTTILEQAKIAKKEEAEKLIIDVISNGKALDKFKTFIEAQGGDFEALESNSFLKAKHVLEIKSKSSGYMEITSAIELGLIAMSLGAGRETKEDEIDPIAGIYINKKTNEEVKEGEVIFTLSSNKPIDLELVNKIKLSYKINQNKVNNPIIIGRME